MKLLFVELQETTASVAGSSTISYVLQRNGGGPFTFDSGVGLGLVLGFEVVLPMLVSPSTPATGVAADSMISLENNLFENLGFANWKESGHWSEN